MNKPIDVGLTSGCFDLIHFGHVHYLKRCRALCKYLVVAVDCDKMVRTAKGPGRPIIHEYSRVELVRSLNCVNSAFIMRDLDDLERTAISFGVGKLFKHDGFRKSHPGLIRGTEGGAELVVVPDIEGLESTTAIIDRIRGRNERS